LHKFPEMVVDVTLGLDFVLKKDVCNKYDAVWSCHSFDAWLLLQWLLKAVMLVVSQELRKNQHLYLHLKEYLRNFVHGSVIFN
jgi:hypothetical protein